MSSATETSIEQRLAALEAAIAEIRRQLSCPPAAPDWLQKISGIMTDKPAFREMIAYSLAYRHADRPADVEPS